MSACGNVVTSPLNICEGGFSGRFLIVNYLHKKAPSKIFSKVLNMTLHASSQQAFASSKLTIETLEKGMKYVQS